MSDYPRIWVLLGHRKGDNNQLLALAKALGLPFETRSLHYNMLRRLSPRLLGSGLASVHREARKRLEPPWPELVLGVGRRSVPVARYIREQSGGRTKIVRLGNPSLEANHFDLVITTPQYHVPPAPNVLHLPVTIVGAHSDTKMTDEERSFFGALPRPHRLMVLGGPNRYWNLRSDEVVNTVRQLTRRSAEEGGTLIAVDSPRTGARVKDTVAQAIARAGPPHTFVTNRMPRYPLLLEDADEIHVTGDSVSMLSEAILTGKPVGIIPVQPNAKGRLHHALANLGLASVPRPDLRAIWKSLMSQRLIGTIDEPRAGNVSNSLEVAAVAVLRVLGR